MECGRRRRVKEENKVMKFSLKSSQMLLYIIIILPKDSN